MSMLLAQTPETEDIGDRLNSIEQSVAALCAKVDKVVGGRTFGAAGEEMDMVSQLQDVATRMQRVEQLLLRTPLPDFKVLDDAISTILPAVHSSTYKSSDIEESARQIARESEVNISINPEYISQFCIDEADEADVQSEKSKALHTEICATCSCDARACSPGHEMTSINWYTCPCCDVLCCSLSCYSRHCETCTVRFYREQVRGEPKSHDRIYSLDLKGNSALQNCLDEDDLEDLEDSDCGEDADSGEALRDGQLEELVARVESGDLDIEDLTDKEAMCFRSELKSASVGSWDSWDPWWHQAAVVNEEPARTSRPSALKPPAHICCAEGRKPHGSVALTSLSAVYAYVHTMRAFNGGWEWAPLEAAPHLVHICPVICSHQVYNSVEECLRSSLDAAATLPGGGFGAEFDRLCLADACALISGGADYCACALQDIVEIFEACLAGGGCACAGKLRRGMKKLEFLTSFAFHHFDLLQPLAAVANGYAEKQKIHTQQKQDFGSVIMPGMD